MTRTNGTRAGGKQALPLLPHPNHLRNQAKAKLALMRREAPGTRLAQAQTALARDYGFSNWPALLTEVASRTGARNPNAMARRLHFGRRFRRVADDQAGHRDVVEQFHGAFTVAAGAHVGLLFAMMIGVGVMCLAVLDGDATLKGVSTLARAAS